VLQTDKENEKKKINMKSNIYITILILLVSLSNGYSQQYGWVPLTWVNNTDVIKRIYQSGNEAWILTNDKLYYSPDYPSVQATQLFASSTTFNDMFFSNQGGFKYGWIVGYVSMGARTIDTSALIWTDMYLSGDLTFSCVTFPNTSIGFASGSDGRLHKTFDGGSNWADFGIQISNGNINTIIFIDSVTGFVGGSAPAFKKTTDGGLTWNAISGYTATMNDIYFYDSTHGWAVGANDIIYYNGSSWIRIANFSGQNLNSVFFVSPTEGWIVGTGGTILHSTNGGATWTNQTSGTNVTL
jgi:photosystem II stability/assembly factor-like uncharacterized protein